MVQIPTAYPPPQEKAIASFDFTDIEEGIGFVHLKGTATSEFLTASTDTVDHQLTRNDLFSEPTETKVLDNISLTSGSLVFELKGTLDFDTTTFNLPRTVKGTAFINGSMAVHADTVGTPGFPNLYIAFTIYHFDGSTETSIGTANTHAIEQQTAGLNTVESFSVPITLTQRHFAKGDQIRVTADFFMARNGTQATNGSASIAHDPQNRNGTIYITDASANHTTLNMFIPFRIDL